MPRNVEMVQKGISILHPRLAEYVCLELYHTYGAGWWQDVLTALSDQLSNLPESGEYGTLVDSLDFANCLRLFDRRWNDVFRKKLSIDYRTWAKELMGVRNSVAHAGVADFDEDYAWRALDTMSRLCGALDDESAEHLRSLARELRYGSAQGSMFAAPANNAPTESKRTSDGVMTVQRNLPSWRTIMEPHPDVAQGRYTNAEFAANLAQVAKGEGPFEYLDPVEFFSRTYVTEGMKGLMLRALKRVCGLGGDPVIQLKTAFGGGKTHSMLALYHLLRGRVPVDKLIGVRPILDEAGVSELVKVHTAVLVGTALNPSKSRRPLNMPGITINTLWGEMAAQLAISAGKPELYDYVKDADKKGVSPGHEALRQLMDDSGPCLILMDELVAYAKKLYGVNNLPAGSFDNFISFIQEITEAACTSRCGLVVASIPESEIEIGGDAGKQALSAIEHTFGRTESVWKPVVATEGFEVVRRRLFQKCKDPDKRDEVCGAFSQMYRSNPTDFPVQAREAEYRERMKSCYPIHPEVFDHLYEEWSTLDKFQRTRGVLRLMAAVIHELAAENGLRLQYMVVSEAGASVYSASKLAAEEFPQFDVNLRSAVSIARRLQDPLAELVKIDPKAVGVGQYQHDMPQKRLDETLDGVVEDCVNSVGVDLNTASAPLLRRVAGLTAATAKNIVARREAEGAFTSRAQLKKVKGLGPKAYEQCAGFLRLPEAKNRLDATAVHPESYAAAKGLLDACGFTAADIGTPALAALPAAVKAKGEKPLCDALGIGAPTLHDIVSELCKPGRDVRDTLPPPLLRSDIMQLEDLKPGMVLQGTVRNVIDFGAFVDLGVHQDGLVHISQISDRFIKHPRAVLKVGDIVKVKVLSVDVGKKRIALHRIVHERRVNRPPRLQGREIMAFGCS